MHIEVISRSSMPVVAKCTEALRPIRHLLPTPIRSAIGNQLSRRRLDRIAAKNATNPNSIFIWVPKTAGTSLFAFLEQYHAERFWSAEDVRDRFRNRGIVTFGHIGLQQLVNEKLVDSNFVRSAYKFAFVRNPFDRAVSLFEYVRGRDKLPRSTTFSIFCRYLSDRAFSPVGLYNFEDLNLLNPQSAWLLDESGKILPDFLGRFETLRTDLQHILTRLQLPPDRDRLKRENASKRRPMTDYYRNLEITIVQDVYKSDFELFGYDMQPYW